MMRKTVLLFVKVVDIGIFPLDCLTLNNTTLSVLFEVQPVSKTRKAIRIQENVHLDISFPFAVLKGQRDAIASHALTVFLIVPLPLKF